MFPLTPPPIEVRPPAVVATPIDRHWISFGTGVALLGAEVLGLPPIPAPLLEVGSGLPTWRGGEVFLRYGTTSFVIHELGVGLRHGLPLASRWTAAFSVESTTALAPWVLTESILYAELYVRGSLSLSYRAWERAGFSVEAGAAVRLLEASSTERGEFVDTRSVLRSVPARLAFWWHGTSGRQYALSIAASIDPLQTLPFGVSRIHLTSSFEVFWPR